MIHSQMEKVVASLPSSAVTTTTSLVVDTLGFDHASFTVMRASNAATTFASVLKVEESDNNSSYSDVTALVGGGVGGFAIPAVTDTAATSVVKLDVDTKARKRYLKVSVQPSTAIQVAVTGRLGRDDVSPTTPSEAGVIGWVVG